MKLNREQITKLLVGDGQKIVCLHWESSKCENGTAAAQVLTTIDCNGIRVDGFRLEQLKARKYRWSHILATPFTEANEFQGGNHE